MEKATHGYHFIAQQEILWWIKLQRNMLAMASGGGNILALNIPGAELGDLVRHTGGNSGAVGYAGTGFVYGYVKEVQEGGDVLVQLSGHVTGKWDGAPSGHLVYIDENGDKAKLLAGRPADVESRAIVGVAMGQEGGNSPKGVMAGLGMEASMSTKVDTKFIHFGASGGAALCYSCARVKLPSLEILEPSMNKPRATLAGNKVSVNFENGVGNMIPFVGLANVTGSFRADYQDSGSGVVVSFFKNDDTPVPADQISGELHVIIMGSGSI